MKYTPQERNAKATQKRSQYARHGYEEVLCFDDWYPIRIQDMKRKGFDIRSKEIRGNTIIGIQIGCGKPIILTEIEFFAELEKQYKEEYLATFGLACEIPFEENAGLVVA